MGWVHKDLKPSNVALVLDPFQVKLIDFNRTMPRSEAGPLWSYGTLPYCPTKCEWSDGNINWDMWALGAIVLECFVGRDRFKKVEDHDDTMMLANDLFKNKKLEQPIKELMSDTVMSGRRNYLISYERLKNMIGDINFQEYKDLLPVRKQSVRVSKQAKP